MSVFSTMLKKLRKNANMTQPELADKLGVSRSTISMYELGSREPDFETLESIADIFNVDMNTLIGKDKQDSHTGATKLRSVARLESSDITPEEDDIINSYIEWYLKTNRKNRP